MMIYGTLIPNTLAVATRVIAAMFVGPVAATLLLRFHAGAVPVLARLSTAEEGGSNILFVMIGAGMAIYGAFLLNGLRSQLHEARKFGQYQLGRKLGEGGMGEVYLAEHSLLEAPVRSEADQAAKECDPIALARFEREVRSAARLAHPNTIEIYDYGHTEDGTFYYVMEFLQGMSLADLVRSTGRFLPAA